MPSRRSWPMRWWLGSFAAGVALPLLILLTWLFVVQVQRAQAEARESALQVARGAAGRLQILHRESLMLLEQMAKRPAIREFDGRTCDSLFAIVDFFPQYANLLQFDTKGTLVCSAQPATADDRIVSDAAAQWIEQNITAGRLPRGPVMRTVGERLVSVLALPVTGSNGSQRGALAVVQLPDIIANDLPRGAVMTIVDRDGTILARSADPHRWTGRNIRGGVTEIVLRQQEGRTEAAGVDGVSRQYGFTFLPDIGWHVYVGIPTRVVMQPVRTLFLRGLAGGALVVIIVVAVALLLSRSIGEPLNALVRAADLAAGGSYFRVATRRSPLEINTLSDAFNRMVDNRGEAERSLLESERNLKALSERLLVVQEEERTRIARAVHDDLGQSITALKMDVLGLAAMTADNPSLAALRERIERTLDATVTSVQQIATELRPSVLDDLGLVTALESEARLFESRTGIECDVSMPQQPVAVDRSSATALYRIVQEALTNVGRHSNATRVELRLRQRPGELLLEVRDDGKGIAAEALDSHASLGLIGIRERAAIVGGSVRFEGIPGGGTIVSVRVPEHPQA